MIIINCQSIIYDTWVNGSYYLLDAAILFLMLCFGFHQIWILYETWLFACRCIKGEPAIEEYYDMYFEAETHSKEMLEAVMQSHVAQKFLTPGRVVVMKSQSVSPWHSSHINSSHILNCLLIYFPCVLLPQGQILVSLLIIVMC